MRIKKPGAALKPAPARGLTVNPARLAVPNGGRGPSQAKRGSNPATARRGIIPPMRRLIRWAFNLTGVVSAVVFVGVCVLWVRAAWVDDIVARYSPSGSWDIDSWHGRLILHTSNDPGHSPPTSTSWWPRPVTAADADSPAFQGRLWNRLGFAYLSETFPTGPGDQEWPRRTSAPAIQRRPLSASAALVHRDSQSRPPGVPVEGSTPLAAALPTDSQSVPPMRLRPTGHPRQVPRVRRGAKSASLKPDTLKIDGNWEEAVKQSLAKKKPAGGWPK